MENFLEKLKLRLWLSWGIQPEKRPHFLLINTPKARERQAHIFSLLSIFKEFSKWRRTWWEVPEDRTGKESGATSVWKGTPICLLFCILLCFGFLSFVFGSLAGEQLSNIPLRPNLGNHRWSTDVSEVKCAAHIVSPLLITVVPPASEGYREIMKFFSGTSLKSHISGIRVENSNCQRRVLVHIPSPTL